MLNQLLKKFPVGINGHKFIKIAIINVDNKIRQSKLHSKMILQIHDELLFDVPKDEIEILSSLVKKEMENAIVLDIPLKVDCDYGKNWFESH